MRKIYYLVIAVLVISLLVTIVSAGDSAHNTTAPYYKSFKVPTITPSYAQTIGTKTTAVKTWEDMFKLPTVKPSYAQTIGTKTTAVKTWEDMFKPSTLKPSINPDWAKVK